MAQQQQYYLNIFSDLLENDPIDPFIIPDPFDNNLSIKVNIETFYRLIRDSVRNKNRITGLVNAYYLGYLFQIRLTTPSKRKRYRNVKEFFFLHVRLK